MKLKTLFQDKKVILDGAMGTLLQEAGLPLGVLPESWNLTDPPAVEAIHRSYLQAGADIVYANTFGANAFKFGDQTEEIVTAGVAVAKRAAADYPDCLVALDIGPLGRLLRPLGDLDFEEAVACFARTMRAGAAAGADLIVIETMNDSYEAKAAMLAAKESCELPFILTCVFGEDGKMMTGADPEAVVALAESLGAFAVGMNCSLGPEQMQPLVKRFLQAASIPVVLKPNAGLPREVNGKTVFDVEPSSFAAWAKAFADLGASAIGGCCGTTPQHICEVAKVLSDIAPASPTEKGNTVVSSYTHTVSFGKAPILIGERINPTGKKRLKQALVEHDVAYVLNEAVTQTEKGVQVLDVNVGLPEINERELLAELITEIQAVTDLPLQIDTADADAMENAMRIYNGKPLINSINGKQESMDQIFPLVKKYGGVVVALTLDEGGIPKDAAGRIRIAKRILDEAKRYGISKKDILIDPLAMTVSADASAPRTALDALQELRHTLGVQTSLGVSNISFGLPNRDLINSSFFAMALERGISAAIMNPNSEAMMNTYYSFCALNGYDKSCLQYIAHATAAQGSTLPTASNATELSLQHCIEKGLRQEAEKAATRSLRQSEALAVINREIIPALDEVGKRFEAKTLFLPQLLMSAEAAASAFEVIKRSFGEKESGKKLKIVLATVKGDIHDIGKNIVKTLLENYGFSVLDLGRDVPPERVVEAVRESGAQVVGLSALMTTTVASMRETIELLRRECPHCRTLVGGAVLNAEYAEMIGADRYAKDAMESVRYCEELEKSHA